MSPIHNNAFTPPGKATLLDVGLYCNTTGDIELVLDHSDFNSVKLNQIVQHIFLT